jgi:hypothetical protein
VKSNSSRAIDDGLVAATDRQTFFRGWFRFSLKSLLLLTTIAAAACYWTLLPTFHARRFAAAIQSGDYDAAESLFAPDKPAFPGDWKNREYFWPNVRIRPISWNDIVKGERRLFVAIDYSDDQVFMSCGCEFRATRRGLESVIFFP